MRLPDRKDHVKLKGVTPSGESSDEVTARRSPGLTTRLSLVILVVAYLSLALTFSLLTRAYEADDESAHTDYVEYIVQHHSLPDISVANGGESHQPPLYYLLEAGWQQLLGIRAFTPQLAFVKGPIEPNHLVLSHDYTPTQREDAVHLHELRLLSVLLGLATVLLTYAGGRVLGLRQAMAFCCGLVVALLPRELVVSSDVTNDALIIPLCALGLVLFLLAERARVEGRLGYRRLHLLGMGVALGLGAITKFSGLPVAGILLVLAFLPSITQSRSGVYAHANGPAGHSHNTRHVGIALHFVVDGIIAVVGFFSVSAWWFIRNKILYGQFLASRRGEGYLKAFVGGGHPVTWTTHLFFHQVPAVFWQTTWYGQPNLSLPGVVNDILAAVGVLCLVVGAWALVTRRRSKRLAVPPLSAAALLGCIASGLIAVIILIKTTSIGDARVAFVGIAAFAIVLVLGSTRLVERLIPRWSPIGTWVWPTVLLALDAYVVVRFLIPLGGL